MSLKGPVMSLKGPVMSLEGPVVMFVDSPAPPWRRKTIAASL